MYTGKTPNKRTRGRKPPLKGENKMEKIKFEVGQTYSAFGQYDEVFFTVIKRTAKTVTLKHLSEERKVKINNYINDREAAEWGMFQIEAISEEERKEEEARKIAEAEQREKDLEELCRVENIFDRLVIVG